jgi:ABC-2 type transport system permease protein
MTTRTAPTTDLNPTPNPLGLLFGQIQAELFGMLRNPAALVPTLIFPVMFWVFFGLPNANQTSQGGFNVGAYILASFSTYSMIQTVLFNLTIGIAQERATGWYRFLRTTPIPIWVIFVAKMVSVIILGIIALVLLLLVGAITANIELSMAVWLELIGRSIIAMLPFAALAVAVGYFSRNVQSASPIINLIFFPMSFGSGLFVPLAGLPKLVQDIAPYLPSYHGGMFVRKIIGSNEGSGDLTHLLALLGFTVAFLLLAVWAYRHDEGSNYR